VDGVTWMHTHTHHHKHFLKIWETLLLLLSWVKNMCANDATTILLNMLGTDTYTRWLSIFSCDEWSYGCIPTYTIPTTNISPDLIDLAHILECNVSVQRMLLHYCWGVKFFQPVSHIHLKQIQSDWAPSAVVNGHLDAYSHCYCIPHPSRSYSKWLSTFSCGEWAVGCILTPLPPQMYS
jgi:hypothetical protein